MSKKTEGSSLQILLVEDNSTDALLIEEFLLEVGAPGFASTCVSRLDGALASLRDHRFDLVLLDLGLPDSQGLETFAQMQLEYPTVPILILSGLEDEGLAVRAVKDGAQDFLVKGKINSTMLSRTIRYAIERKISEQRLKASEVGYRRLFETTQDGIFILDAESGKITDANPFLEKLLGYTLTDFIGKRLWEIAPFRDKKANQAAFATLKEDGYIVYSDLPLATKSGRFIDVEFVSNVYTVSDRQVIQCNIRDITERKLAEEELRASEQRFQNIVANTPGMVYQFAMLPDDSIEWPFVGQGFQEIFEIEPGVLQSNPCWPIDQVHPDDRSEFDRSVLASKETLLPRSWEGRIRLASGTTKWIQINSRPQHLPSGGTLWNGLIMDITARKEAEEERDRFFTLSLDMLAVIDSDGYFKRLNPAFEAALGITNAELMAVPFMEFVHPDDHAITAHGAARLEIGLAVTDFENRYRCRDGSYKWLRWTVVPYEELWYCVAHDVTGDKEAAAALRESEERFRQMAESVDEVFWLFDPVQGKLLYVSPAYEKVWERTSQSLLDHSMSFIDTVHPDDRQRILAALEHQGEPNGYSEEHRIVRPDGSVRWVWARTFPIYNEQGELYRIAGIAQDIDVRKEAEAALSEANNVLELRVEERTAELQQANTETRAQARQQEAVAELGQLALTNVDMDTLLTIATALVTVTLGVEFSAVLELRPGGDTMRIRAATGFKTDIINHVVSGRADSQAGYALLSHLPVAVTNLRSETRFKPSSFLLDEGIVSSTTVIVGSSKQPFGTLGAHTLQQRNFTQDDIHFLQAMANVAAAALEQRRTEEALYKNHEFLQAVLENTAEGIVACDADGQLTFFNRATREFHGLPLEPLPSDRWSQHYSLFMADGVTPMRQADVPLFKALRGEHVRNTEMVIAPHEGSTRLVTNNGEPLFDAAGGKLGAVVVMHDITERRQAEVELQRAKEEADAANAAKSEFLSRMSHELRTPLNAILGFGQIMEMQELTPLQSESTGHILKGGRHLLELINEVLNIARIEAGHTDLSTEPVPIHEVIRESLELMHPLATQHGVRIDGAEAMSCDSYVMADRQRLKQVLINLLSNAVKYNRNGGSVSIICEKAASGRLRIRVNDTGPGISAEDLKKLFVPFERLNAAKSGIEGTGLGLALSRRLTEAMNGTLSVESVEGQGSTFTIDLPLTECLSEKTEAVLENKPQVHETGAEAGTFNVLSIEDNSSNFRLIEAILQHRPAIKLEGVTQGSVGLDLARQHHFDLILLDLHLPDITGYEVLCRLREYSETRDIPVVVISADATATQIKRVLDAGANFYLTKPLNVKEILQTVDTILKEQAA
ncbi:MAG TPA: PAS domain S-box protein [Abditibacteriaceae bacterium]|jgi:PAS domain S-box-containing protein